MCVDVVCFCFFDRAEAIPPRNFLAMGLLVNSNTVEDFKNLDKKELLSSVGSEVSAHLLR